MDYATLIKEIPGYKGWGEAEALADFASTGGAGKERASSVDSIDFSQVPSVQGFVKDQFSAEDPFLSNLVMRMRAQRKPLDIYGELEEEAGLPELRATSKTLSKEIADIEDYIDMIEPDITARTRESLVTEAQRRGMVSAGKEPFLEKLTKLGTALGRVQGGISEATQGIGTKTSLALQGQEQELEPYKLQYQTMVERNSRLLTGFTADRQTQLDILMDKLQRQRQLDDREWELANTLASEEREYMKSLQQTAASAGYKVTGQETADDLLAMIGTLAAEEIAWNRRPSGGTATERASAKALESLKVAIGEGVPYYELAQRFEGDLPAYQIAAEYNAASPLVKKFGLAQTYTPPEGEGASDKSTVQYWIDQGFTEADAKSMAALYAE